MMWHDIKSMIDWIALGTTIATLAAWIPAIAGLLSIVWGCYRIYDIHLDIQIKKQQLKRK